MVQGQAVFVQCMIMLCETADCALDRFVGGCVADSGWRLLRPAAVGLCCLFANDYYLLRDQVNAASYGCRRLMLMPLIGA